MLRQATYTRTHGKTRRQYRWQRVNANGVTVEQIQWLKGRAQPQVCGLLTTQGDSIHACRANALGIIDCADFPPANRRTALAFIYQGATSRSPQLSLLQGAV